MPDDDIRLGKLGEGVDITKDGFLEIDDFEPVDVIGLELDFKFGKKFDKYFVHLVMCSGNAPCPQCQKVCDDCVIMKTERKTDGEYCDIFVCRDCGFSMSIQPTSVVLNLGDEK